MVDWFSETLFDKNFLSGGRTTMALTKIVKSEEEELDLGLGSVTTFTRGLGRKRVLFSSREIPATESTTPVKRQRSRTSNVSLSSERSRLESLPQELLIRVVCGVDHDDLNSLNIVSKSIREASLVAKELHFSYNTPKKTRAFRNQLDFEDLSQQVEDVEPPNAPVRRHRWTDAKRKEKLSNVSVALFT